ncbi:FecR domain-containing protein [Fulvivirgaceae bacterium BMA12]|uniref:FecR domain-containing protein n=1 Tax=Agaribacillus aureus TaxID=3051825 RepID=A0ABT8LFD1_9BACT|nr:FecR domain-containing protein [Fulvivirgaceae bacterium BMA12]
MNNTTRLKTLFERFLKDQCSPEEVKELYAYIKEKSVSSELDPLLEDVWSKIETYPTLDDDHRRYLLKKIKSRTEKEKSGRRWRLPLKIAAVASVVVVAVILSMPKAVRQAKTDTDTITKTTQPGQRALYILPDGSSVSLNAGSAITFPKKFDNNNRAVVLEGEAFFDIVRNPKQPFIVASAGIKTKVLGTSFNIRAYQGENIEVTVATGKVEVESLDKSAADDSESVLLSANEQAVYNHANGSITQSTVDIRKYLAWHSKELILENISVKDAILMLEKRFDQKIILSDREVGNCIIRRARYEKESLETILKGLQSFLDLEYEFNGYNQWIITGQGCK